MASSYNNLLNIEEIGTGEQAGTWGTTTNTNIADTLPEAITGRASASINAPTGPLNLEYIDSNSPQAVRNLVLNIQSSGNLTGTSNVVIPNRQKQYIVENNTTGTPSGQSIVIKTAAGTGVTIPNGKKAHVFCDGTNVRFADDYVDINGGSIDDTPIGAATPSTGVFTTGTIDTLLVGTQTNKATISYTTDAARTITIPAVSGNRTFAFLEEAQTFTAAQTYNANQTVAANLIFSGNARRIQGAFATYSNNSTIFQNSTTNATTALNVMPNGTGGASAIHLSSTSDLTDSTQAALFVDADSVALFSLANGTKSLKQLRLVNGGIARLNINPDGAVAIGGEPVTGYKLSVDGPLITNNAVLFTAVYGVTVGGSFRTVYIDSNGQLGGLSSTRESKANIAAVEDTSWLMNLEPVSFKRRKKDKAGAYTAETYDNTEYGLIADDVVNVRPEICVMADGKLSGINYEQLISPMLKEIQKLRAEVEALKAKG